MQTRKPMFRTCIIILFDLYPTEGRFYDVLKAPRFPLSSGFCFKSLRHLQVELLTFVSVRALDRPAPLLINARVCLHAIAGDVTCRGRIPRRCFEKRHLTGDMLRNERGSLSPLRDSHKHGCFGHVVVRLIRRA